MKQFSIFNCQFSKRGFSTLPTVLILGGLMLEVAIAVTFLLDLVGSTNFATRQSAEAFNAAYSGIEDGLMKVVRDKNCPQGACISPYDLVIGGRAATVVICRDSCAGIGKTQIESIGASGTRSRRLQLVVSRNDVNGRITVDSFAELSL